MAQQLTVPASKILTSVPTLEERIAFWLGNARSNTRTAYAGDLGRFAEWLGADTLGAGLGILLAMPRSRALHTLEQYQAHLKAAGRAPATVNRAIAAVNAALKEARKADVGPGPLEVRSLKARNYRDTKGPGLARVARLLEVIGADARPVGRRDRAIILLLAERGLRRAEVAGLTLEDLDLAGQRIRVNRKGADSAEWLAISAATVEALGAWLMVRNELAGETSALFVVASNRKRGAGITGAAVYRIVTDRARQIGAHIRPHGLRHGAITELIQRSNGNVAMAQAFAGHASPSTTTRYIDNLNDLAGQGVRLLANVF